MAGANMSGGSTARELQPHADAQAYFDAWSATYATPTLLIHADLRIIWRNGAAMDMLRQDSPFAETAGILLCADRTQAQGLRRFLAELSGPDAWIYLDDGDYWILRVEPLAPDGHEPGFAASFYCHRPSTQYVWADFGRVFSLTRSETDVVKGLIGGASAEELADTMQVSIQTIRTHIKRTYGKMGVNNREQMFALLMQFRVS